LIALSYAQQANFDLEGARNTLQQAVQSNPDNALAWARLAELHMSFADLNDALEAAHRAVALDPNLSRTQTVLGFAYLTQIKTTDAKRGFTTAIELDQADPLPRLGLGLAIIRDGDLDEGRRQIEIAVSLDPDNALMRSYLGKAYFEEKRDRQAARQYEMAKQLDPRDPTPYFYDAIRKQTTNRPVEALQDMQKAIELNDNRAVYRSRLLLDSDLAARSAALGRIYSDLGFQQLALVEGWKSVNTDPSNFSAHRFLADSYSILPRHEIARVSELLQSQLLQPLNTTPVQPRLAESNLFLISSAGPGTIGFNEFNPLFMRNGINFQSTGLAGQNGTYAGEGVLSGIYKKASFSLGGFHFQTDGWRTNSHQTDIIGNAFLQVEISPETSVQGEYRFKKSERGDIQLRFFPDEFLPSQRFGEERNTARVGLRHSFSSSSVLLGSFIYQNVIFTNDIGTAPAPILSTAATRPETATSAEFQHLYLAPYLSLTSGGGYARIRGHTDISVQTGPPLPPGFVSTRFGTDLNHINLYVYSRIKLLKDLALIVGASGDITSGESPDIADKSQFNPKFGLIWNPFPATTLRVAAFRALKRTLITDQTLEPTQVSGFNQFFDDNNGTSGWRYGTAIDQKITHNLFAGLEFATRNLRSPFVQNSILTGATTLVKEDIQEDTSRAYIFWTPHPLLALRSEYLFEHFSSDGLTTQPERLQTHRLPLGIGIFHPSGFGASMKATYINQSGRFILTNGSRRNGRQDFWTLDASINYRLPKRYGLLTFGATNIADRKFKFFERDMDNPSIQPARMIFGGLTLALP
jgi:tetratricopeptide (TPR) repeat protein